MSDETKFRRPLPTGANREDSLSADAREFYAGFEGAEATRRAYNQQFRRFVNWCESVRRSPEPATTATVLEYIHWLYSQPGQMGQPTSPNTVELAVAAIMKRHSIISAAERSRDSTVEYPRPDQDAVGMAMRAYRRRWLADGHRIVQTREIAPDELRDMTRVLDPESVTGARDLAILTLSYGMMARSAELASLTVRDITIDDGIIAVHVPWSKTDQSGHGEDTEVIRAPRDPLCPVTAVTRWLGILAANNHQRGPLFVKLSSRQRGWPPQTVGLQSRSISAIVSRIAVRAQLPSGGYVKYGVHSLRSGAATSAARAGARLEEIISQGRWSDDSTTVLRYLRRGRGREQNPMRDVYRSA